MVNMIRRRRGAGFGMVEVLIALLVIMIGLLGLIALQGRALTGQMEAYKRAQAIVIAKDMVSRIRANRDNAVSYATTALATPYLGIGNLTQTTNCVALTGKALDFCEWHNMLRGAAETVTYDDVINVGAMDDARGCIVYTAGPPEQIVVTVVWRGLGPSASPAVACGSGNYGTDDALRRVITIPVTFADLDA